MRRVMKRQFKPKLTPTKRKIMLVVVIIMVENVKAEEDLMMRSIIKLLRIIKSVF